VFAAPSHLSAVLERLDRERRGLFPAGISGEVLPAITRLHGIAGDWHQVAFSALSVDDADRAIAEQAAFYRALGANVEWTAYAHDAPEDLLLRLQRHGFELGPREAVVVLDARVRRPWLDAPAPCRLEPVRSPRELREFAAAAEQIFGADQTPVVRELEARLLEGSSQHIAYVAYAGSEVAAVGRLYTHPESEFAGLYGGGTLEAYRGRGLYRAMVARRARDAVQAGARYLRVDALPTSQPILERLGFELLTYLWPCVLAP
jgi:acetyltransferase (GNAT) family protein